VLLGAWLLIVLDGAYLIGRRWAHERRRRANRARRDAWTPDASVRRPLDYPGVLPRPAGDDPVDSQGRYRATGIRLAALPALAVVFLTVQTAFLDDGGPAAFGFVLTECLLLIVMVWTVWTTHEPSRPWITSRVKAELFRREMFLLLTGTGPYRDPGNLEQRRDARLNLLNDSDLLNGLIRLADRDAAGAETDWRDDVWRHGPIPADADTVDRMRTYLNHRIRRQALYFEFAQAKCETTEGLFGRVAKGTILTGVAVALAYAVLLVAAGERAPSWLAATIALLAAGVPPLCNSVLAVQNLFAAQRLAASYRETRRELLVHENTLRALLTETGSPDAATRFRALALGVETTLTEELRRWRIIVARPEFDAGL
jgi:hypothetical protein